MGCLVSAFSVLAFLDSLVLTNPNCFLTLVFENISSKCLKQMWNNFSLHVCRNHLEFWEKRLFQNFLHTALYITWRKKFIRQRFFLRRSSHESFFVRIYKLYKEIKLLDIGFNVYNIWCLMWCIFGELSWICFNQYKPADQMQALGQAFY